MSYQFKKMSLASAVALSFLAAGASASTVDLTYHGASSGNDAKGVKIKNAPATSGANTPLIAGAFGFKMRTDAVDPLTEFLAWCLDIGSNLGTNGSFEYKVTNTPFSNSFGLDPDQRGRVQSVFDANYGMLDIADGIEAAGFQVALWDALYDDDGDASAGDFRISSGYGYGYGADIIKQANYFLRDANMYKGGKVFNLTFFESTGEGAAKKQNLVTATPVPLPAAGLLFLGALGGLAALRRRKAAV
ncbi:VPLPA-CTERM sorting domain-containing protein [Roseovarius tolerans]|uniref:VPLPA-CTERM sorting domain-containing protein n=1 Tax=Roseovarius tolerans TaxID=74031 RepID=UPI00237E7779|nr:VPLPA-CTERM sorting domain-containing protein [Roseovarius tolerans]